MESLDLATLEKKIDLLTHDASKPYFNTAFKRLMKDSPENANIICDYITAELTEINIKQSTKEGKIKILIWLANSHPAKSFKEMTKQDILQYLNTLRKPVNEDPTHRWVGSYNGRQMILNKFFRWLFNPDEPNQKKRLTPPCMQGVKRLPRQEKTPYKHSDMWESREHAIFLKYCPDKRDSCYHTMANDMSARPHELLGLKISDIKFNVTEDGLQYAEVLIKEGKTGPRTVPLIDSIPYVKEWISSGHPTGTNSNSWLFVSHGTNSFGLKLTYDGLVKRYSYYKNTYFPGMLEDKRAPDADKAFIKNMLTKPWNLYIFRHSSLTDKSQILSESVLRDHAGWTMSSMMPQVYIHLRGESSKILLQKRGIMKKEDAGTCNSLGYKVCPNCTEPNKRDSKFCAKCKMILSYNLFGETLEYNKKKESEVALLKIKYDEDLQSIREEMKHELKKQLSLLLKNVKPEILEQCLNMS